MFTDTESRGIHPFVHMQGMEYPYSRGSLLARALTLPPYVRTYDVTSLTHDADFSFALLVPHHHNL